MKIKGLNPVRRRTALEAVTDALNSYIIANGMKSGDRLPPEHSLCEALGVSRNILREGMRHFRALGIIESRPRVGACIRRLMPDNPFGGYLPFMGRDPGSMDEILESRIVLELGAAPLLVERCAATDIAELREIVAAFGQTVAENIAPDSEFHRRLMAITGNRILMSMAPLTVDFFECRIRRPGLYRSAEEIVRDHHAIIDALELKSVDALRKALREHYESYKEGE